MKQENECMKDKKVWIVVPLFNRFDAMNHFISCLQKQTFRNVTLVIVDHGTDDYAPPQTDLDIKVLKVGSDLWWTAATNQGIAYALEHREQDAENYLLVINDDVDFDSRYIEHLLEGSAPNRLLGSMCRSGKRIINQSIFLNRWKCKPTLVRKESDQALLPSDLLSGRGMFFPLNVIDDLGMFDEENFPQYGADYEFAYRAKQKGYDIRCSTKAVVHTEAKTAGNFRRRTFKEHFFDIRKPGNMTVHCSFARKHYRWPYRGYFCSVHGLRLLLSYVKQAVSGR